MAKSKAKAKPKPKPAAKPKAKPKKAAKIGLIVSVRTVEEARAALRAGATIIDVKEPGRGPLGIAPAEVVEDVVTAVGHRVLVSASLGDWHPDILTEAVWHLKLPLAYVKWGLAGYRETPGWGLDLLDHRRLLPNTELVAVAYADWQKAKSIAPAEVARFAKRYRFKAFLLDTFLKDGKTLLNHIKLDELAALVKSLQDGGVKVALAGSLTLDLAKKLKKLAPDWFAVRGAVCLGGKRRNDLDPAKVKKWKAMLA